MHNVPVVPWKFHPELLYRGPSKIIITLYIILGTLVGSAVGFIIAMRFNKSFNKRVRQSVFFREHPELVQNPNVRKSLALPDDLPELNELNALYDDEDQGVEPKEEKTYDSDEGSDETTGLLRAS